MTPRKSKRSREAVQQSSTTHPESAHGRPRLIFSADPEDWDGNDPDEFDLLHPTTRIGAADDVDLRLDGLEPLHAEIVHDEDDEYVLFVHAPAELSSDLQTPSEDAPPVEGRILRTGARIELGDWAMSYYRDEPTDHGRPFGGREGGESEQQLDQSGRPVDQTDG